MRALTLFLLSASLNAAVVSSHNEPHAGIQAAIDRLDAQGCTRYQVTRSGQYTLNDSTDKSEYMLTGNTITIKCTRFPAPTIYIHYLTWGRPTTRADKSPLLASEISGYMLEIDGYATNIGNVLTYSATYSVAMQHVYRIATIDTLGRTGPYSEEIKL